MKLSLKTFLVTSINVITYFVMPSFLFAQNQSLHQEIVMKELNKVDLSNDSIISAILNEATGLNIDNKPLYYYTVYMNRYKKGTIVRIIRSEKDIFDERSNILGYEYINDQPVVFYKGVTNYTLPQANPVQSALFKLGKLDYNDENIEVYHYYIMGDIYARFSKEDGWIWSDGKPDE